MAIPSAAYTAVVRFPNATTAEAGRLADDLRHYLLNHLDETARPLINVSLIRERADDMSVGSALGIELVSHAVGHAAAHLASHGDFTTGVLIGTAVGFTISQLIHNWQKLRGVVMKTEGLLDPAPIESSQQANASLSAEHK